MSRPRILSVGQCGFDHGQLDRYLRARFDAEVAAADTHAEALQALRDGNYDLVLVNRIGNLDGAPGLTLIRALKADPALAGVPVMLVSNYESAQSEATDIGALPGFGKTDLGSDRAAEAIREALPASS